MRDEFQDKHLKTDPRLYEYVCIPLRITIALLFMLSIINSKYYIPASIFLAIAAIGLSRKMQISSNSWKPYLKSIVIFSVCIVLMLLKPDIPPYVIGTLLLLDVTLGFTTKFVVNKI